MSDHNRSKTQPLSRRQKRYTEFRAATRMASAIKKSIPRSSTGPENELCRIFEDLLVPFQRNVADLPGKPDIVVEAARLVVFCDGDFWHGRDWEQRRSALAKGANAEYWIAKIESNIVRDQRQRRLLRRMGWSVLRVWEKDLLSRRERVIRRIQRHLQKCLEANESGS